MKSRIDMLEKRVSFLEDLLLRLCKRLEKNSDVYINFVIELENIIKELKK
jgi:hypothetical protein